MGLFRRKDEIISPTQPPQIASLNGEAVTAVVTPAAAATRRAAASTATSPSRPSARASDVAPDFRLTVADAFAITGRGTVVTGRVDAGWVRVRGEVDVVRGSAVVGTWRVTGIERDNRQVELAQTGDAVGLLFKGAGPADLQRGDLLRSRGA
jgi:translation elongation factor EF-Tu-like GTPase